MITPSHETEIDSASFVNKGNKEPVVQCYSFQSEKLQAGAKDCDPYLHRQKKMTKQLLSIKETTDFFLTNKFDISQDDLFINIIHWISVILIAINISVQRHAHRAN